MFLFMYISGWLSGTKATTSFQWIKGRAERLLIPDLIWTLIAIVIEQKTINIGYIFSSIFLEPIWWYLPVLFICDFTLFFCDRFSAKYRTVIYMVICFAFNLVYVCPVEICTMIKMTAIYLPFYGAGVFVKRKNITINKFANTVACCLYPVSMLLYSYKDHAVPIGYFKMIFDFMNFSELISSKLIILLDRGGLVLYNHYIVAPLGCIFFWNLFRWISRNKIFEKALSIMGRYSLQLYILAGYFTVTIDGNMLGSEVISVASGVAGALIVGCLIGKSDVMNRLLFGQKRILKA